LIYLKNTCLTKGKLRAIFLKIQLQENKTFFLSTPQTCTLMLIANPLLYLCVFLNPQKIVFTADERAKAASLAPYILSLSNYSTALKVSFVS
jgi:hypothetical protein